MSIESKPIHTTLTGANSNILPVTASSAGYDLATGNIIYYNPPTDTWFNAVISGSVTNISSSGEVNATYVLATATGSLPNSKVLTAGPGIFVSASDGQMGVSASLLAGTNMVINLVGNAYAISSSAGAGEISASYILASSTSSLPFGKVLMGGPGIIISSSATVTGVTSSILAGPNIIINQVGNSYAITGGFGSPTFGTYPGTFFNETSSSVTISQSNYTKIFDLPFTVTSSTSKLLSLLTVTYFKNTSGNVYGRLLIDGSTITSSAGHVPYIYNTTTDVFADTIALNVVFTASAGVHTASLEMKVDSGNFQLRSSDANPEYARLTILEIPQVNTGNLPSPVLPSSKMNVGYYKLSSQTTPDDCGAGFYVPIEHLTTSGSFRTIVSTTTGSNFVVVALFNVTSQSYVHIGGPGITGLSSSNTTPTLISSSVNLLTAINFNSSSAAIYETQIYGVGTNPISVTYGSTLNFF